jgi:hypothetical protein
LNAAKEPQRDFTFTLAPGANTSLRIGRAYLTGRTVGEWLYFVKTTKQRSANFTQSAQLEVPLSYVAPRIGGSYGTTRQRLNAEIDVRARRKTKTFFVGSSVRLSARTSVDAEWLLDLFDIADDEFLGVNLQEALSRRTTGARASLEYVATPLTTIIVRGEAGSDRFDFTSLRDSDSVSVKAGVQMKPLALFAGEALVGVRHFAPLDSRLPVFTGLVSAVGMTYNARETTKFNVQVGRDVDYSFLPDTPYFVMSSVTLGMTQVLGASWDVIASGSRTTLSYRALRHAAGLSDLPSVAAATDRSTGYHLSLGYHFAFQARIGFDVDYSRRDSTALERTYDGFRAGGSFSYGL